MRTDRSFVRPIAALAVAAACLVSCGGSGEPGSGGEGSQAELDRSARLVYSGDSFAGSMDPHKNPGGNQAVQLYAAYDRLIHSSPDGELEPGLATEWEVAEDGMSMELTLREDVVFHDGTPFTAEAVRASVERAKQLEDATPALAANAARIEAIEIVDEHAARLVFTEPYYTVEFDLAVQLGAMISPAAIDGAVDLDSEAVGAGPYRLVTWRPGQSAQFERFEDYWDPDANPLAGLELRNLPDSQTRFNAVASGQAQIVALEARLAEDAEAAGLTVENFETLGAYNLFVNADLVPEWQDARVRRAFAHAIDRQGLVDAITGGLSRPTVQPIGTAHPAFNPDYPGDHYAHDPERSRDLLDEAGVEGMSLDLLVLNRPEDIAIGEALQAQLAEAGVTVDIEVTEPQNFTIFVEGQREAIVGHWSGRQNAMETLQSLFVPHSLFNPSGWITPELQAAIDDAARLPLGDERDAQLREAFGTAAEQAVSLSLYNLVTSWTTTECVVGFEPYLSTSPDLRNVGLEEGCA